MKDIFWCFKRNIYIPLFVGFCYNIDMKKVKIIPPYITLGQFLKLVGVISNGSEAKFYLSNTKVLINDEPEDRRGRKLYEGFVVVVCSQNYLIEV